MESVEEDCKNAMQVALDQIHKEILENTGKFDSQGNYVGPLSTVLWDKFLDYLTYLESRY